MQMNTINEQLKPGACRLILTNDAKAPALACALVRRFAADMGFADADLGLIELGVEEAVSNVVRHALPVAQNQNFDILVEADDLGLAIRIRDQGQAFDPRDIIEYNPDLAPEVQADAGLGTQLLRRAFDLVEYLNLGEAGNELGLIKYRPSGPDLQDSSPHQPDLQR